MGVAEGGGCPGAWHWSPLHLAGSRSYVPTPALIRARGEALMAYHSTLFSWRTTILHIWQTQLSDKNWPFFAHFSTKGVGLTLVLGAVKYVCSSGSGVEGGHNSGELK